MKILKRIGDFFFKINYPELSFSFSQNQLAGIKVDVKNKKIDYFFIHDLDESILKPSFYEPNILNEGDLRHAFEIELKKIKKI